MITTKTMTNEREKLQRRIEETEKLLDEFEGDLRNGWDILDEMRREVEEEKKEKPKPWYEQCREMGWTLD